MCCCVGVILIRGCIRRTITCLGSGSIASHKTKKKKKKKKKSQPRSYFAPRLCSRAQLAVFSGPSWDVPMAPPAGRTVAQALEGTTPDVLPPGVPALATRWTEGMTFGEFGSKTIAAYHQ
jgi:hypothetical protein